MTGQEYYVANISLTNSYPVGKWFSKNLKIAIVDIILGKITGLIKVLLYSIPI